MRVGTAAGCVAAGGIRWHYAVMMSEDADGHSWMDLGESLALMAAWLATALAVYRLPELWSGDRMHRLARQVRGIWPFGDRTLLGVLRATHVVVVAFAFAVIAVTVGSLEQASSDLRQAGLVLLALSGSLLALAVLIAVFSVPRALIPPSLRGTESLDDLVGRGRSRG